jgi:CRP-like cAMP-binding protein
MSIDLDLFGIFKCLDDNERNLLSTNISLHMYKKDELVHFEGDFCDSLEMIDMGSIHIEQLDVEGNEKVVQDYSKGTFFGLNFLFASNNYFIMNVIASSETRVLSVKKEIIMDFIDGNNSFRYEFIKLLSDNARRMGMKIKTDFRVTLREKIYNYISVESIKQQSEWVIFHTTKTLLAKEFGVERTSLSRELQKMMKLKMIEYNRRSIRVIDKKNPN